MVRMPRGAQSIGDDAKGMHGTKSARSTETIDDEAKGLHVTVEKGYASSSHWFRTITENARWYRVKYKSGRFQKECETPCWTTFYGGMPEYEPYEPVPSWLQPLVDDVSSHLGVQFNAMLLRLYFDGDDEIAWHTDGRTFLGHTPTIASLSFGANATFQMRRMTNTWPPLDGSAGDCIDRSTPQRDFVVGDGDMLIMRGVTQKHWHHRVPKQKGRRPRLNINFRYIIGGPDAERGQKTYYKYMVHGDEDEPRCFSFKEIMAKRGGMMNFARPMTIMKSARGIIDGAALSTNTATSTNEAQQLSKPLVKSVGQQEARSHLSKKGEVASSGSVKPDRDCQDVPLADLDSDAQAYLASESDVDASTFLALPGDLRSELIREWKMHQKQIMSAKRPTANGTSKREHSKRRLCHGGVKTLDIFFSRTKKS